jgi:molecular chaperone GrpE
MKNGEEKAAAPSAPTPKTHDAASKDGHKELEELRGKIKHLEEDRERLRKQNQELSDKHLRARADYDNLVKRSQKDVEDTVRFVKSGVLLRVASLVETLETLSHDVEKRLGSEAKGVKMLLDEGKRLLKDEGVKEIPSKGLPFNFRFHQAVERVETSGHAEGVIVDVVQRGYQLGEEILRPALVKVAVPPKATQEPASTDAKT